MAASSPPTWSSTRWGGGRGCPGGWRRLGGQPLAEEAEDSGFAYYTRYFGSAAGGQPRFITGLLTPFGCFSLLTLPGDSGTWSVTIYISSRDQALKELRHPEKWTALVAACPLHAQLLDGEPLTDVLAMSGIVDRHRRLVVDGTPVVTGLVAVGDSACCTNPSLGRGITMGLLHAAGTVEVRPAPNCLACSLESEASARLGGEGLVAERDWRRGAADALGGVAACPHGAGWLTAGS